MAGFTRNRWSIIPDMTSDSAPAPFVASSGGNTSPNLPFHAFDGNVAGGWWGNSSSQWLQIDLGAPRTVEKYTIIGPDSTNAADPKNWTFAGSNDGSSWTTLDTQVNRNTHPLNTMRVFSLPDGPAAFRYFRISVSATCGGWAVAIYRMELIAPPRPVTALPFRGRPRMR